MSNDRLPPIPGSTDKDLQKDSFDRYYRKRPSDIWTGKVHTFEYNEPESCKHEFIETLYGVQCKRCFFGLIGKELKIKDGHVYFREQLLL